MSPDQIDQSFDSRDFKTAMGRFLTGVTIVSCLDEQGKACGLTVNSFASVSLEPPLVLWSLIKGSSLHNAFSNAEGYSIAILADGQKDICYRFASDSEDRFQDISWRSGTLGLPIINDCLSVLECKSYAQYDGGDHIIFVGEVMTIHNHTDQLKPLSYFSGKVNEI